MDGIHDVGGMHGFGAVEMERDEPVFHARWEAKVFAMLGVGFRTGAWYYADQFRHGIERIDPAAYLSHGYYGRWLGGIETLLVEAGVFTQEELTRRAIALGASPDERIAARPDPAAPPIGPRPARPETPRPIARACRFAVGDVVRTIAHASAQHTRLPRYARGKRGVIQHWHEGWVYPDSAARGLGDDPQHLYTVSFPGTELWGSDADPKLRVHLDLFEPYLQPDEAPP